MNWKLILRIAGRYLFSSKSTNAINVISGISAVGMGFGAFALILVLSVFNGFESLVTSLYNVFYADIRISPLEGKKFELPKDSLYMLSELDFVKVVSSTLEENAYFRYDDKEYIGMIKGVDSNYARVSGIDSFILYGDYKLKGRDLDYGVFGAGLDASLGLNVFDPTQAVTVFVPKRGKKTYLTPEQAFNRLRLLPIGIFAIQQEFDSKYVLVPLDFAQRILRYESGQIGALELKLKDGTDLDMAREKVKKLLGDGFVVKDKYQQNALLYNVMKTERWAVFAILSFLMLIISFNIIGSLSMLVIEKTRDIGILQAMGATRSFIRMLFLSEGALTSILGAVVGMFLAFLICLLQIEYGLIKLQGSGSFVIDAYPVKLKWLDFAYTFLIVVGISLLASWFPAKRAANLNISLREA